MAGVTSGCRLFQEFEAKSCQTCSVSMAELLTVAVQDCSKNGKIA